MKVKNKVFVVTGAGSGLGRELTKLLIAKGAKVAMVDVNTKGMEETSQLSGAAKISMHTLNIANRESIEQLPDIIRTELGEVDGIINNAGIIQPFVNVNDIDYDKIQRIMDVNFYGTLYMIKTFLPYLLKRPEASICNISSMGGFIPFPGQTIYGASKAAVKLLTEGLSAELKDSNVNCTVILPGAINTNIMANSGVEPMDFSAEQKANQEKLAISANKAAEIVVKAIEAKKFRATVGKDARFLDIFYRISPQKAVNFILKKMGNLKH